MNNTLDDNLIINISEQQRKEMFISEVKRYGFLSFCMILYLFFIGFLSILLSVSVLTLQNIPIVLLNILIIYFIVSIILGSLIATFQYRGFNFRQRFIRASVVLFCSILFILSLVFTFLLIAGLTVS